MSESRGSESVRLSETSSTLKSTWSHGSLPHSGNPWLRWALVEATHELKQHPGPVRDQFTKLLRAKGRSKATIAAARKLCYYVYWMLTDELSCPEWLQARQRTSLEVRPS